MIERIENREFDVTECSKKSVIYSAQLPSTQGSRSMIEGDLGHHARLYNLISFNSIWVGGLFV